MPRHNFARPQGQFVEISIDSKALAGNLLGDPHERCAAVYLPPGYDPSAPGGYPVFVALAAFGGSGLKLLNWSSFGENLAQRLDRLIAAGEMGPVILVMPDGFTRLGGNQWIDSAVMGNWEQFVLDELLPAVEERFNAAPGPSKRAVFGHSSGGYAALIHAMRHGDRWGAAASHSGDVGFELVYGREFPSALAQLARYDNQPKAFLDKLWAAPKIGREFNTLMLLAMAATYAPELEGEDPPPLGIRLPVDPETCARDERRWARWLARDPLEIASQPEAISSMKSLRTLFIDCGSRDEYFIHFGTRALVRKLEAAGVEHIYEEFDGGHSGVSYRLDRSLPLLYRALTDG